MSKESAPGYVYILTNKSFREDWIKIGKSGREVDIRSKELDNTAVPLPFDIYATVQTKKYSELEKLVHRQIDRLTNLRIRQGREFFNIHPDLALEIFKDQASVIEDAVVFKYINGKPVQVYPEVVSETDGGETKKAIEEANNHIRRAWYGRKERFSFDKVGLRIGDKVRFDALGIEVPIADTNKVEYDGRLYTLSAFVGTFLPEEMRNTSGAYQGPKYFSYNGKKLTDIRNENESFCEQD